MQPHEYSIIGHSRAKIGRSLGTAAGILASFSALVASAALDLATRLGFAEGTPRILLFPLTAALFYSIGHWAFDNWIWRWPMAYQWLNIPNLAGTWDCLGTTDSDLPPGVSKGWKGILTITQTWEKIRVYVDVEGSSRSRSVAASLIREPGRGVILMYSYRNEPDIAQKGLSPHVGYCELTFNEALDQAHGEYFNNKGRVSHGHMELKRKEGPHAKEL